MKNKFLYILAITVVLCILFMGCNVAKQPVGQEIRYHLANKVSNLDPARVNSRADFQLINTLLEGLIRLKPDGTFEMAVAKDYEILNEGKTYTFHLRDARWSNGKEVNAQDFEYAWNRVLKKDISSPYLYLFDDVASINVRDKKTLVVELNEPNAGFIYRMTHPAFFPLPKDSLDKEGDELFNINKMLGNGPFRVTAIDDEKYELIKNKNYWDEKNVRLEKMTWFIKDPNNAWEMYKNNDLDVITDFSQDVVDKNLNKEWMKAGPVLANYYYIFNVTKGVLEDKRVRKALSISLDRNNLVKNILQGGQNAAKGIIPEGMPLGERELKGGQVEEARELLSNAGYTGEKEISSLVISILNKEGNEYVAKAVTEQWEKDLSINIDVKAVEWDEMKELLEKRNFDIALFGWATDFPDPIVFLKHFTSFSGSNYSGWRNVEFDKHIKSGKKASSVDEYMEEMAKAERILLDDMPIIPLYDYTRLYGTKTYVQGIFISPVKGVIEFKWAYID